MHNLFADARLEIIECNVVLTAEPPPLLRCTQFRFSRDILIEENLSAPKLIYQTREIVFYHSSKLQEEIKLQRSRNDWNCDKALFRVFAITFPIKTTTKEKTENQNRKNLWELLTPMSKHHHRQS